MIDKDTTLVLRNETDEEFKDISSEEYRQYSFLADNGFIHRVTINDPLYLNVRPTGHRILDAQGISHFIPTGWKQLSWKAKNNQPHFGFVVNKSIKNENDLYERPE
jgi:hypothetical protein